MSDMSCVLDVCVQPHVTHVSTTSRHTCVCVICLVRRVRVRCAISCVLDTCVQHLCEYECAYALNITLSTRLYTHTSSTQFTKHIYAFPLHILTHAYVDTLYSSEISYTPAYTLRTSLISHLHIRPFFSYASSGMRGSL